MALLNLARGSTLVSVLRLAALNCDNSCTTILPFLCANGSGSSIFLSRTLFKPAMRRRDLLTLKTT